MSNLEFFFADVTKFLTVLGLLPAVLVIFLHEPKTTWWQRLTFVLAVWSVAGFIAILNGTLNGQVDRLAWFYPWITGIFFAAAPSVWVSLRGGLNWPKGLWLVHYFPAVLALVSRSARFATDPEMMRADILSTVTYDLSFGGSSLYVKTYVVYLMVLISAVYYLILARYTRSSKTSQTFLGLIAALAFTLFYPYLLGDYWPMWRPKHLVLTLTIETLAVAYTFYVMVERYRGMLQDEQEVNEETLPNLLTDDAFGQYLEQVFHGEKRFLRDDYSMDLLASDSGFSAAAWRAYFKSKDTTFLIVKKRMRIDHATQLIVNGYLDNHTVEALTSEIGYASRSTFYTAFQEIKGKPFPQYLQELRNT